MKKGGGLGCLIASHALLAGAGYFWQSVQPVRNDSSAHSDPPDADRGRAREKRLAAAMKEFGPGTDFVARMTSGVSSHKRRNSPETAACLAAWFEHDSVKALRWLATDRNYSEFTPVLFDHINRHGDGEIVRLLNEAPESRWPLCSMMYEWMKTHKSTELMQIAGQVKGSEARVNLLQSGFLNHPDDLVLHLPQIRAMLDERAATEFFWYLTPTLELAEAAEKAGFPDKAVKEFSKKAQDAKDSQTSLAAQLAMPEKSDAGWLESTLGKVRELHPELAEWSADFAERGLPAETVVARLKQAEPALSGHDDESRRLVFEALFTSDAEAATRWLIETRPDWKEILEASASSHFNDLRAEEFWRLSNMVEDLGTLPILREGLETKYSHWFSRDPQGFLIGIDSMAPGGRRDQLVAAWIRGSDDKVLEAELIRRIDEPGLRAKMEKQSKQSP